jgi:hypothetical protein
MENLTAWVLGLGSGLITLFACLWLSAERDLNRWQRDADKFQGDRSRPFGEPGSFWSVLMDRGDRWHDARRWGVEFDRERARIGQEIAVLRRQLDDYRGEFAKFTDGQSEQVGTAKGDDATQLHQLRERSAELARELSKNEQQLSEMDLMWNRLRENPLGENRRDQVRADHSRQRKLDSPANERRTVIIQQEIDELLNMQAAMVQSQRRFQDALIELAALFDSPARPMGQPITFEEFKTSRTSGPAALVDEKTSNRSSRLETPPSENSPLIESKVSKEIGSKPAKVSAQKGGLFRLRP